MPFRSPQGTGVAQYIASLKPIFVWDAYRCRRAMMSGKEGGPVKMTFADVDSYTDPFSVWDDGQQAFKIIDPTTDTEEVVGTVGDFIDGKIQNFGKDWTTTTYGFSVISPTASGDLYEDSGVKPDIIYNATVNDVTTVDTDNDATNDFYMNCSHTASSSFIRCFQILIKSDEGHDPNDYVDIGINSSSTARTTDGSPWLRELPGGRGWWALKDNIASGSGAIYVTIKITKETGKWRFAAPIIFSAYSHYENLVVGPIPRTTSSNGRGQWYGKTTNAEFSIKPAGWLAMSIVLPDRGIPQGHLSYAGTAAYQYATLFHWGSYVSSGDYRVRVYMHASEDEVMFQIKQYGAASSVAFLNSGESWNDFERIGAVMTWGISNGTEHAALYINGEKKDSVSGPADWPPDDLPATEVVIGNTTTGYADNANAWIPRVAAGTNALHRADAKKLSIIMRNLARGGRLGLM